jgi:hypothetical protein
LFVVDDRLISEVGVAVCMLVKNQVVNSGSHKYRVRSLFENSSKLACIYEQKDGVLARLPGSLFHMAREIQDIKSCHWSRDRADSN